MAEIICFGEIMLRLSPPIHMRFAQANWLRQSAKIEYLEIIGEMSLYGK